MKEPNVLEAHNICMNGNPIDYRGEMKRLGRYRACTDIDHNTWEARQKALGHINTPYRSTISYNNKRSINMIE
jgi:hypothetical protein